MVTQEQFQQTTNDMIEALNNGKEDFCKGNYYSFQDEKIRLNALITEIMMCKAGYIIDQTIQEYKDQVTELNRVKDQIRNYTDVVDIKKVKRDKLIKEIKIAKQHLEKYSRKNYVVKLNQMVRKDKIKLGQILQSV